jgi:hypothetical protein
MRRHPRAAASGPINIKQYEVSIALEGVAHKLAKCRARNSPAIAAHLLTML